jgi:hypothetical protein
VAFTTLFFADEICKCIFEGVCGVVERQIESSARMGSELHLEVAGPCGEETRELRFECGLEIFDRDFHFEVALQNRANIG